MAASAGKRLSALAGKSPVLKLHYAEAENSKSNECPHCLSDQLSVILKKKKKNGPKTKKGRKSDENATKVVSVKCTVCSKIVSKTNIKMREKTVNKQKMKTELTEEGKPVLGDSRQRKYTDPESNPLLNSGKRKKKKKKDENAGLAIPASILAKRKQETTRAPMSKPASVLGMDPKLMRMLQASKREDEDGKNGKLSKLLTKL